MFPLGVLRGPALTFLAVRPTLDGAGVELSARAYGADGGPAAIATVEQIRSWVHDRSHSQAIFRYWPVNSDRLQSPSDALVDKTHGAVYPRPR